MNIEDYGPSQPIDDRRGETYYGRGRPRLTDARGYAVSPQSLLDMLRPSPGVAGSYATPAGGMAEQLGYNQMGRQPMPSMRYPYPNPLAGSAADMLYRQRLMRGTGGTVPYPGDMLLR